MIVHAEHAIGSLIIPKISGSVLFLLMECATGECQPLWPGTQRAGAAGIKRGQHRSRSQTGVRAGLMLKVLRKRLQTFYPREKIELFFSKLTRSNRRLAA